jgi:hypothetical protein
MREKPHKDHQVQDHLLMFAHSIGAGGMAFACMAAIARDEFSLGYSSIWDFGWATIGSLICWVILLHALHRDTSSPSESTSK